MQIKYLSVCSFLFFLNKRPDIAVFLSLRNQQQHLYALFLYYALLHLLLLNINVGPLLRQTFGRNILYLCFLP